MASELGLFLGFGLGSPATKSIPSTATSLSMEVDDMFRCLRPLPGIPSALKEPFGDFNGWVGVFGTPFAGALTLSEAGGSEMENP